MKYSLLIFLGFFLAQSCDDTSNAFSPEEIEIILKAHKDEIVFLSFYPNMDENLYESVLRIEKDNGKVRYGSNKEETYPFKVNSEELDFVFFQSRNSIMLYFNDYYTSPINTHPSTWDLDRVKTQYNLRFDNLLQIYLNKYGQYTKVYNSEEETQVYQFKGSGKVIHVWEYGSVSNSSTGSFRMHNEEVLYGEQFIRIIYFSDKSYKLEVSQWKADLIEKAKSNEENRLFDIEQEKQKREQLEADI